MPDLTNIRYIRQLPPLEANARALVEIELALESQESSANILNRIQAALPPFDEEALPMSKPESTVMLIKARALAVSSIASIVNDANLTEEVKVALIRIFLDALDNIDYDA